MDRRATQIHAGGSDVDRPQHVAAGAIVRVRRSSGGRETRERELFEGNRGEKL